jgi:hypothetical protein
MRRSQDPIQTITYASQLGWHQARQLDTPHQIRNAP